MSNQVSGRCTIWWRIPSKYAISPTDRELGGSNESTSDSRRSSPRLRRRVSNGFSPREEHAGGEPFPLPRGMSVRSHQRAPSVAALSERRHLSCRRAPLENRRLCECEAGINIKRTWSRSAHRRSAHPSEQSRAAQNSRIRNVSGGHCVQNRERKI